MPNVPTDKMNEIIDQLATSISDDAGNMRSDELDTISGSFDKTLADALKSFNSQSFDDDGFIRKLRDLEVDDKKDKDMMRNVLNNVKSDYISVDVINQSELLLRRDLENVCIQMPEMRDVIYVIRDAIIECNVATGEVSRTCTFENNENNEAFNTQIREIEERHELPMAIKNFIVPRTLKIGENMVHVASYAKMFAELEALRDSKYDKHKNLSGMKGFRESVPQNVLDSFTESVNLDSKENEEALFESVSASTKVENKDLYAIYDVNTGRTVAASEEAVRNDIKHLLSNIEVQNGSSILMTELGYEGFKDFLFQEYKSNRPTTKSKKNPEDHFMEAAQSFGKIQDDSLFSGIDQDVVDIHNYKDVKGCYLKYLDPLRTAPIRIGRRVVGYYYVTTTMDLQNNAANPNGIVDLSFQGYTRDKNLVDNLANMIIRSFSKPMLERNIKLKNEIAEIIIAHKFSEGKLSFVYIPEDEVVRFVINEDEEGKGHSVIEPTLFPARMYLMLTMYNMIYTLNNVTTRVHYLKSSGLDKNYSAQIQRTMRNFQRRRINIDDIYSYSGVMNKIGGMGEMILPEGRNGYKALETDTIQGAEPALNMEFLESQRRQAISGTGVPHLMMINAIDEADFAKTLEMANTRFLSTVSSYKIDFNRGLTKLYQKILKYSTDIDDDIIASFRFKFNPAKQQELNITADMLQNFDSAVEAVESMYYTKPQLEDKDGNATITRRLLRKKMAQRYLPQFEFDELDEMIKSIDAEAKLEEAKAVAAKASITQDDLKEVEENPEEAPDETMS